MTFDEWPSPLCPREERGAEADSRWDCTQSNNMFFPSRSCSLCSLWTDFGELHGSVKWCSSAHVTFLLAGRSLCVARTKTKFLNRTMHWKITMFRVGPHHWSIWQWRTKEQWERQIKRRAQRNDSWFNILPEYCTRSSVTQYLWSFVPALCRYLLSPLAEAERLESGALQLKPHTARWRLQLAAVVYNVICTFNLNLGRTLL